MLQLTYKFVICFFVPLEFYTRFMKVHVECNTCACKYHTEMVELKHGFNNMRTTSKGVHGRACNCSCDVCSSEIPRHYIVERTQFSNLINMWSSILCPL